MRAWRWVAPALAVLVIVTIVPIGRVLWTSLHRSEVTAPGQSDWTGLGNYQNVVTSREWWLAVATTLVLVAAIVVVQVVLGCLFAAALSRWTRAWPVARAVVLLPLALLSIAGVVVWRDAFDTGFVASWFTDGEPGVIGSLVAVGIAEVWRGTGLVIVVVTLALGRVPTSLLSASTADGATARQRWVRVVMPSIGPALAAITTFRVLDTFRALDGALLVDRFDATVRTAPVLLWNTQFTDFELGLGAAMAIVLLVVAAGLTVVVASLLRVRRVLS